MILKKCWLILFAILPSLALASATPPRKAEPTFKKIMIVVFENADYADAINQPDFAKLATRGAELRNFHAETHPSQPNYLALVSGDTHGIKTNDNVNLNVRHLADLLDEKHKSWKVYLEGYPGGCFTGESAGEYVRKHNPLISFSSVREDPARCAHLVPATELKRDIQGGTLPDFSLYIPDLKNDGHDTGVDFAGRWLSQQFLPSLGDQLSRDLLLAVTFDESEETDGDNQIYTVLAGSGVRAGAHSKKRYDHYSLLRLIEDRFDLGNLGAKDKNANVIDDVWKGHSSPTLIGDIPARDQRLRIVTYNIWGLPGPLLRHSERFGELPAAINSLDADIVLIQEAFTDKAEVLTRLPNFPYYTWGPKSKFMKFGSGLLVLSRYPITQTAKITYPQCGGFDCFANKGALYTRIEVPGLGPISVINTHLNANSHSEARRHQTAHLSRFVRAYSQNLPTIVGGDFNGNITLALKNSHGASVIHDTQTDEAYTADPRHNGYLGSDETLRRLDYIYLMDNAENWKVLHKELIFDGKIGRVLSDHFGIRIITNLSG